MHRDIHRGLKTDVVKEISGAGCDVKLVRVQWSKADIGFGLHVHPTTFSTAGLQGTDFLKLLGFARRECAFLSGSQCYSEAVQDDFDVEAFAVSFDAAYGKLEEAQRDLDACGYPFPQPEGWGYFFGKASRRSQRPSGEADGHTASTRRHLKASEDGTFRFVLTWIEDQNRQGWTIHYRPKHSPASVEIDGIFRFLELSKFPECPEFDFDECSCRFIPLRQSTGFDPFNTEAEVAHRQFDAHQDHFSPGVKKLLEAHALMERAGFRLLPFEDRLTRHRNEIRRRIVQPLTGGQPARTREGMFDFDVAISFAGTERAEAERLAILVRDAGLSVFYDDFYREDLWGKDLTVFFDEVFRKRARYCVVFVSKDYLERPWTIHERRSAMSRVLEERGLEYILPIRVDEIDLPGLPPTIGYRPIGDGIETIAELLVKKLL